VSGKETWCNNIRTCVDPGFQQKKRRRSVSVVKKILEIVTKGGQTTKSP
jgi:hypothetical protein